MSNSKPSFWQRLTGGLRRTASALGTAVTDIVAKRKLDAQTIEELEEALICADLGIDVSAPIAAAVGEGRYDKTVSADEIKAILAAEVERVLTPVAQPLALDASK